jgi:hypothetical protein
MNKRSLLLASLLLSVAPAFADDDDVRQQQHDRNANRRSRQAEAIKNLDDDQKADAAQKAHERNQNARSRQKEVNENIDDR